MKTLLLATAAAAVMFAFGAPGAQAQNDPAAGMPSAEAPAGGHEGGRPDMPKHKMEHKMGGKMFEESDTDGDGKISKAEWVASAEKRFGEIDADGDGAVTKEEMKAHHEKMKEHRKEMREKMKDKMEEGSED